MEILISIVAKIAEYTVEPVVRQLGYVWFIDRNFQNLKSQVEKLKDTRDSVKGMVLNARRNAQDIKPVVEKWLSEVDVIIGKSEEIILNEGDHVRLCPNLVQRHKLSRKASKLADEVIGIKNEGNFDQVSYNVAVSLVGSSLPKISDFFNFESRKKVMKEIIDALLDDDVNKVGVYGMGGVGKTMLVKEILRELVKKKSFDEVVISTISQTPDLRGIQGQLADKLGLNFQQETIEGRAIMLQKRLKMEKSVLVVLDDVWEYIDLETIGIPSVVDHKGCKILFTSRDKYLLKNEMCVDNFFEIEVIQKDESWDLFKTMVGEIVEDLNPIANQIVTECARLPIAITTVAKALRNKRSTIWKDALDQLKDPVVVNIRGMEKEVYSSLKLSYNYLEGEEVKLVFLLCSMFLEDSDINVEHLQVYAMGLGFLHGVDTVAQGRRRITKLVDDLISSSLLLPYEFRDNYVKMHDLVRDVAISIASKNDQIRTISYVKRLNKEWDEEKLSGNHTAMYLDFPISHSPPKKLMLPNLQLLRLHGSELVAHKLAATFFEGMKELKCLDIINVDISLLLPSLYNSFANIRLLRLIYCDLGSIDMIGELKQLEILSFKESNIIELPTTVSQLTQLKVLDLSSCEYLKVVRPNILSKLTKLEELYLETFDGWEREDKSRKNASLSELRDLSHLYVLNLNIQDETIMPKQLFSRELDLENFQITIGRREIEYFPRITLSRMLRINMESGCCLNDWIKTLLKKSEDLCLVGSIGTKVLHSELHENDSSHLKHLKLFDNLDLQHLIHGQNKHLRKMFSNLEYLEMKNLKNFESINHGYVRESLFNKLRSVTVENCNKLESLFFNSILDDFLNLDKIEIKNCKKMEAITVMMNTEEATNQIEFAHLKTLWLQGLPRLQNFCSKIEKVKQLSLDNSEKADTKTISCNGDSFFSEQVSLPNLERLEINGADNLKMIWPYNNILIPNSFSKLKKLEITSCNSLEKVLIPSNIMSMLTCLVSLSIKDCKLLEGIFEEVQELNATEKCLAVFRNLRRLKLSNLPNLEYIRSKDSRELRFLEDITNFFIHECPKLKRAYPVKIVKQLESLEIDLDDFLEVFEKEKSSMQMFESKQFETSNKAKSTQMQDGPVLFSKLKDLKLSGCLDYKLTHHLRLPMEVVRILHNLESFGVSRIFIEEIFPNVEEYQNATSMPLRWLSLSELPKLRHLWKENSSLENLEALSISRCSSLSLNILFPSSMSFTSLVHLKVNECHRLTHLLVPSIATTLVQLRFLTLSGCKGMITVMAEGVEEGNDEIVFNKLTWLTLKQFSKLRNFYSGKCIIKFPRLTEVSVTNCPEMKTFSLGVVSTPCLSTEKIESFENGRWFPALKNHSEKEILVKDINVIFRQIWEDNYDTDVKYLFPEENFDEENQSDPSSSSSYIVEERE